MGCQVTHLMTAVAFVRWAVLELMRNLSKDSDSSYFFDDSHRRRCSFDRQYDRSLPHCYYSLFLVATRLNAVVSSVGSLRLSMIKLDLFFLLFHYVSTSFPSYIYKSARNLLWHLQGEDEKVVVSKNNGQEKFKNLSTLENNSNFLHPLNVRMCAVESLCFFEQRVLMIQLQCTQCNCVLTKCSLMWIK